MAVLADRLGVYDALLERVVDQTRRRVFDGETVPAQGEVVSLFEPHTDIIVKGGRGTCYGHKVNLATVRSGLPVCRRMCAKPTESVYNHPPRTQFGNNLWSRPIASRCANPSFPGKKPLAACAVLGNCCRSGCGFRGDLFARTMGQTATVTVSMPTIQAGGTTESNTSPQSTSSSPQSKSG